MLIIRLKELQRSHLSYSMEIGKTTYHQKKEIIKKKYKDICVGNDIWFGKDVTVMPEVSIGDGAIIGAGSIVASDVPPYSVAVGNPAKVAKYRFSEHDVEILLMISWWNWNASHIKKALNILNRGTVIELQDYAYRNELLEV